MPEYDSTSPSPPAPIAYVILRNPENGLEIINVPMLLDTGSDATLLPRKYVEKLDLSDSETRIFELAAFDEATSQSAVVILQMIFEGRSFRGEFLTINQDCGIIGRNVLNSLRILFDGQNLRWEIL